MQDTSPEVRKIYHEMLMSKSNEERFMMGISMCESVRRFVIESFPKGISEREKRRLLLQRYYGIDLDELEEKCQLYTMKY
ncbi:MAG: hypothetical protein K9N40_12370 [Candidatus Cloacimonetes bacterium]|nr:hypothetical protein [Candidatus Cloacimonadota bacterium]